MKKILIATAAVAMIATSCSNNEIFEETQNVRNAIQFDVTTNKQTKAGDSYVAASAFTGTQKFGVFAYYTDGVWADKGSAATPAFMFDTEVAGAGYAYSDAKYWPNNETDKISFFAYYPSKDANVTLQASSGGSYAAASVGLPKISFTVPATAANQVDLMYAGFKKDQTKTDGTVAFTFNHALTQVVFSAKASATLATGTTITVKSIKLDNIYQSGVLSGFENTPSWTQSGTANGTYEQTGLNKTITSTNGTNAVDLTAVSTPSQVFLLMPQTLDAGAKISVTYTVDGGSDTTAEAVIGGSSAKWDPNQNIRYTLVIGLSDIKFSASVTPWVASETPIEKEVQEPTGDGDGGGEDAGE